MPLVAELVTRPPSEPMPLHAAGRPSAGRTPFPTPEADSLVRVPCPDCSDPPSATSTRLIVWASVDALHHKPDAYTIGCARLATASQKRQGDHEVSFVRMRTANCLESAPALTPMVMFLRVFAIVPATAGHPTSSDGVTAHLTRRGGLWLADHPSFC